MLIVSREYFFSVYVALVQNSTRLVSGFYLNISLQFITCGYF